MNTAGSEAGSLRSECLIQVPPDLFHITFYRQENRSGEI